MKFIIILVFVLIPISSIGGENASAAKGELSLGLEFASGKYGGYETTRTIYAPLIATWFPTDRFDFSVEIPMVYQSSPYTPTGLYQSGNTTAAKSVAMGYRWQNNQVTSNTTSNSVVGGTANTYSGNSGITGLGDIVLRAGYISVFEGVNMPQIRPSVFIKTPTADRDKGIGTGEFDAGIGVEISKWYGKLNLYGEGFYVYQGEVSGWGLKNYLTYSAGTGYQLTENIRPRLAIKGGSATSDYSEPPLEMRAQLYWLFSRKTGIDLYISKGFSDSSPDFGSGAAVVYTF